VDAHATLHYIMLENLSQFFLLGIFTAASKEWAELADCLITLLIKIGLQCKNQLQQYIC
jgi:hypothetical protein